MPRNKRGGNRHKKQARKGAGDVARRKKARLATAAGEIYAKVTRVFGNGMADVLCNDGITRLLIIRKKFKGRNKRDTQISLGGLVLAGIREWEVVGESKKPKVDLLYVYKQSQLGELISTGTLESRLLPDDHQEDLTCGFEITPQPQVAPLDADMPAAEEVAEEIDDDFCFDDI